MRGSRITYFKWMRKSGLIAAVLVSIGLSAKARSLTGSSTLKVKAVKPKDDGSASSVEAKTKIENNIKASGVQTLKNSNSLSSTYFYGQIRMEGMQYFTSIKEAPSLTTSQFLSARLSYFNEGPKFDFASDISAGTFFIRNQTKLGVHELYLTGKGFGSKLYVGRKKFVWSELDSTWQLGTWQPHVNLDALRPEEQALVGAFYNYQGKNFEIVGLASPIYVPTLGPDIREEDGSLKADSRWYRAPSSDFDFNGRKNIISYKLDIPEAMKLANNQGAALMGRLGSREYGPWASASAGYKPANDLLLKRRAIKSTTEDIVNVTVEPVVTHHSVYSADVGYSFTNLKFGLSYLEDAPKEVRPEPGWVIQRLDGIKAWSANMSFSMNNIFSRSLALQASYLRVDGASIQDIGSDGAPDDMTLYKKRLKFNDALMLRSEGQITSWLRKPIVARLKWLYDFQQQGSILNTEALYYPKKDWALVLGADVIGVQDETKDPDGFLNQFRANDRFYGGVTYVF